MALEAYKQELVLGINKMNKPATMDKIQAWSSLILKLIFLIPGTLPSMPDAGIGISTYEYDDMDAVIDVLETKIPSQIDTYLPDIPVESITVTKYEHKGRRYLFIKIGLFLENTIVNSAIAMEVKHKIIDFDVSWP